MSIYFWSKMDDEQSGILMSKLIQLRFRYRQKWSITLANVRKSELMRFVQKRSSIVDHDRLTCLRLNDVSP